MVQAERLDMVVQARLGLGLACGPPVQSKGRERKVRWTSTARRLPSFL